MENDREAKLARWRTILDQEYYKCIRCGECRTVCPVFRERPSERYTARGKLAMIHALAHGQLRFTPQVREALDNCLLCGGCSNRCSSDVRADKLVAATRMVFAEELGIPTVKKLIGSALCQPAGALDAEARAGTLIQRLLFRNVPESSGMYRRFALPFIDELQYVPRLADTPLRQRLRRVGRPDQPLVLFFTGCMINYAMTEIGLSTLRVLARLGHAVELPEAQGCCGMPMLTSGDLAAVKRQARKNLQAFAACPDTPIVTACASCGHMLKHGYLTLLGDDSELAAPLQRLAARTMDISEFLVHRVGVDAIGRQIAGNHLRQQVSYHDPCHLRKAQNIHQEPRLLLQLATGNGLRELEEPDACCGLGGTYFLLNRDTARRIQMRKQRDAIAQGGHTLATACPGCVMQLRDGVGRSASPHRQVRHCIELLAEAFGPAPRENELACILPRHAHE